MAACLSGLVYGEPERKTALLLDKTEAFQYILTSYIGESLAAGFIFALVRLFASMNASMDGQGASLDETFAAERARVGSVVCVDSVMPLKIRLAVKHLIRKKASAGWTHAQ